MRRGRRGEGAALFEARNSGRRLAGREPCGIRGRLVIGTVVALARGIGGESPIDHEGQPMTVIGRNGELLSRKPQHEPSLADKEKNWRRRTGLPEQRDGTFPIFVTTLLATESYSWL